MGRNINNTKVTNNQSKRGRYPKGLCMTPDEVYNAYLRAGADMNAVSIVTQLNCCSEEKREQFYKTKKMVKSIIRSKTIEKEVRLRAQAQQNSEYTLEQLILVDKYKLDKEEQRKYNNRNEKETDKMLKRKCALFFNTDNEKMFPELMREYYKSAIAEGKSLMTIWEETKFSFGLSSDMIDDIRKAG